MRNSKIEKTVTQINKLFWENQFTYDEVLAILGELNQRQFKNKKKGEWEELKNEQRRLGRTIKEVHEDE